ncbi:OLC1v1017406C1 [Oldenlandia corymbosa var. corymbosa]|uniref:OLC1v1017406C1 n=1 Tax=Oldenlandia corymbosa var. corymbosa TaxID=529605 RepID=A0AAV1E9C9_OLDCO|nr:OLC1v1017406C1 [Oldenlandia corymbosa var. corymbosa]
MYSNLDVKEIKVLNGFKLNKETENTLFEDSKKTIQLYNGQEQQVSLGKQIASIKKRKTKIKFSYDYSERDDRDTQQKETYKRRKLGIFDTVTNYMIKEVQTHKGGYFAVKEKETELRRKREAATYLAASRRPTGPITLREPALKTKKVADTLQGRVNRKRVLESIDIRSFEGSESSVNNFPNKAKKEAKVPELKGKFGKDENWLVDLLGKAMEERRQATANVASAFLVSSDSDSLEEDKAVDGFAVVEPNQPPRKP